MIRAIEIEYLRGISKGRIEGLTQVNILLGRNGSGKSTVLEAIYIASACIDIKDPIYGMQKLDYVINRRGGSGNWDSAKDVLWFSMNISKPISIKLNIDGYWRRFVLIHRLGIPCTLLELDDRELAELGISRYYEGYRYVCICRRYLFNEYGSFINLGDELLHVKSLGKPIELLQNVIFVDSRAITRLRTIEKSCWSKVVAKRLDKKIVGLVRKEFEPDAEGLTYIPLGNEYVLALQLSKTSVRIDDLGDGAKIAIITGLMLLAYKPKILLMEEPENHMHPAGLETYMRFVLEIAKEIGMQVLISSHSIELVKIVRKICSDLGLELSMHFLERSEDGELSTRRLSAIDSEVLEKLGLDPRFLYVV